MKSWAGMGAGISEKCVGEVAQWHGLWEMWHSGLEAGRHAVQGQGSADLSGH